MSDALKPLDIIADIVLAFRPGNKAPRPKAELTTDFSFYEFFAGGGMARAGLGARWRCLFANDFDFKKAAAYKDNWGEKGLVTKDVSKVTIGELPGHADLVWASFPCQDLSLAGMGAGLRGERSGTFWPFWQLMKKLKAEGRGPRAIVLENVCGTLTSHGGKDFTAIADALSAEGYRFGAVVIDAADFVPQSRPRLFIIAIAEGVSIPANLQGVDASLLWHPKALQVAHLRLKDKSKAQWVWWKMPAPPRRNSRFVDLIEENPQSVSWHTAAETAKLINMMSDVNFDKVTAAKKSGQLLVGAVYKRTRLDDDDEKVQRAEIRFDDIAGCLRTSSGGSSRQSIVVIKGDSVRSRLLSSREAARLMGLPEEYKLPKSYNEAYHLIGDGLVVPVVRYLAEHLLEPILMDSHGKTAATKTAVNTVRKTPRSKRAN
ncbi:MAG: DNA cytosine methyltransferase [Rhizobiales bacterium]|nr:DNA cytosine methyltransferase [Hyphomicrobiales bacterium]